MAGGVAGRGRRPPSRYHHSRSSIQRTASSFRSCRGWGMRPASISVVCTSPGTVASSQEASSYPGSTAPRRSPSATAKSRRRTDLSGPSRLSVTPSSATTPQEARGRHRRVARSRCVRTSAASRGGEKTKPWPYRQPIAASARTWPSSSMPLRDDLQAERAAEVDHQAGELRALVLPQLPDELAVDLQRVDREAPEVGERRVAGAEIVDGDPHPALPQSSQPCQRVAVLVDQDALGDLKDQGGRGQPPPARGRPRRRRRWWVPTAAAGRG